MQTVLVIGSHRSGTSIVAGMLDALGVAMGPPGAPAEWTYPNWANPTGQFENPEFSDLLHRLLDFDAESALWDPAWDDLSGRTARFLPEFVALVRRTESERWGWKHPWSLLVLEPLLPHTTNPYFVVIRRDPKEVVDSLVRRDRMSPTQAEEVSQKLWARLEALLAAYPEVPRLTVEYADVSKDPAKVIEGLTHFLGLTPSPDRIARAREMVLRGPALRRAIRRAAIHDLLTLPYRYAWLLTKDLREHSRFTARHLAVSFPGEGYRILRAAI